MVRVATIPLGGKGALAVPGTNLVMQVERVMGTTPKRGYYVEAPALVLSTADDHSDTVLDSGATEHISPSVKRPLAPASITSIHGLSGKGTPVTGMGTINKVKHVMCCPRSSRRLLSVGRLLEQLGGRIVFTRTTAYHMAGDEVTQLATRTGAGLYTAVSYTHLTLPTKA